MSSADTPIVLSVTAVPELARLVRMTAANVAMLSSMSVDRVEDIRMAAEEAFIYACSACPGGMLSIEFRASAESVSMAFSLGCGSFTGEAADGEVAAYADLILAAVCDSYEKRENPSALVLELKADVYDR